eukprot:767537-Hanusia_phi.AAC.2
MRRGGFSGVGRWGGGTWEGKDYSSQSYWDWKSEVDEEDTVREMRGAEVEEWSKTASWDVGSCTGEENSRLQPAPGGAEQGKGGEVDASGGRRRCKPEEEVKRWAGDDVGDVERTVGRARNGVPAQDDLVE